jgi:hypothetical protein
VEERLANPDVRTPRRIRILIETAIGLRYWATRQLPARSVKPDANAVAGERP